MSTDQRLKFFEDHISSSLKPRGEELRRVFSSEALRSVFVDFLCSSEARCLFASCFHDGALDVSLKPPTSMAEKTVAFLKCKHVSKVSQDTMEDILYIEFAGEPLDNLLVLLREVFLPLSCLSSSEESGFVDKLLDIMHCVLGSVEVLAHHTKGEVVLPQPSLEVLADVSSSPSRHGGVMHVLETCIVTWLKQIKHALQSDPHSWTVTAGQFPGVLDEREYWQTRLFTLVSIREQLSSLLALTILSHLEEARSSYSGAFGQVYKDVDKAMRECQLSLMFLNTLHPWVLRLRNAVSSPDIMRTIPALMRTVYLVWKTSQYYGGHSTNLERLLVMVANDIIVVSRALLPDQLFDNSETSLECLGSSLTVCAGFRGSYLDHKVKADLLIQDHYNSTDKDAGVLDEVVNPANPSTVWPAWTAAIFHKLNAFMERCNDLHEVTATVLHFRELQPSLNEVLGSGGSTTSSEVHPHQGLIYEGFEQALSGLTLSQQDMLDLNDTTGAFESKFFTFRSKVKTLETQAGHLLCDIWDKSSTNFSKLRILELFNGLCSREAIQAKLFGRSRALLSDLSNDMLSNQEVLQRFSLSAPLLKDVPPTSSALVWLQGFRQRVRTSLDRFQPLNPELLASEEGWKLRDMQRKLLEQIDSLQLSCYEKWELSVPHNLVQTLEEPVLRSHPGRGMAVNITPLCLLTLKEAKYIVQTSFADRMPRSVVSLIQQCKEIDFSSKLSRLSAMIQEYNTVQQALSSQERDLLKHRIVRIQALLDQGCSSVSWSSDQLEEYISVSRILISGDFVPRVQSIQDIQLQVRETVASWEKGRDGCAFSNHGDDDDSNDSEKNGSCTIEHLTRKHRLTCESLETCLSAGMKRISSLMEEVFCLTEASQDSPVWSEFVEQVDAVVLDGLKRAFLAAVGSLMQRVLLYEQGYSISPLVTVKLELLQQDVSFVPALDALTSVPSIPETVKKWLTDYLRACGQVTSWRKNQQSPYHDVLSSDGEVVAAMNKVTAHLETSARHCRSLRNKFLSYSFMWEDDVEESFQLFLKGQYVPYERHLLTRPQTVRASARSTHGTRPGSTRPDTATTVLSGTMGMSDWTFIHPDSILADSTGQPVQPNLPTLDDFDMQIAVFEGFKEQLNNIDDYVTVGWLMVNVRPVKHVLQSLVSKWKYQFTCFLANRVRDVLETLNQFLSQVEPQVDIVTGSEDNWDYIKNIISVFNKVTTKAQEMDGKFGAVHRTVRMVHKYGHMIPAEAARFLSVAPQRWSSLKKRIGIAKQRVSPKVQANSQLVIQDLKAFGRGFDGLVESFQNSPSLLYDTPLEESTQALTRFRDRLRNLQVIAKDLDVIQELLEKNIFNFSKLNDFSKTLDTLEKLLETVSVFASEHSDWRAHKWCEVATTVLTTATAVQQEQLRNMPGFCSHWDIFLQLCREVEEMQLTLPVINDLLRPSLRPRHWKQVVRLAIPRKSASRSAKTKASEIKRFTLGELMGLALHSHAVEIRSIAERADKDLAIELAVKTFEEVWLSRVFDLKPLVSNSSQGNKLVSPVDDAAAVSLSQPRTAFTTPALSSVAELGTGDTGTLENAEEVSETVSEHQTSLQALLGTSSASSFMEDLNKWRKILQTIEAVLKLWMSVQDLWHLLRDNYLSEEMRERLPGPALAFSVVDQEYHQLMKHVEKNSNVMHQCLKEGQLSKLEKMYTSLNSCRLQLLEYTRSHQERCPWFLFLPSDDVLRFICQSSGDPGFLSANLYKILPTVHTLGLGWSDVGEQVHEIIGHSGDVMVLDNPLSVDVQFEELLELLLAEIGSTLSTAITSILKQYRLGAGQVDAPTLKVFLLDVLQSRRPHQVVLVTSWTLIAALVLGRGRSVSECRDQLSQLVEFVAPLQKCRPDEALDRLRGSAAAKTNADPAGEWEVWQVSVLRDIMLVLLYYRNMLSGLDQGELADLPNSFTWFSSVKYSLSEGQNLPVLECGAASIPYGLQYTGLHSSLLLPPQTEKSLFSLVQAVDQCCIALCLGNSVTAKQECFFTLAELSGHMPFSFACSQSTRLTDIRDVLVAAARTGSWLFVQGVDALPREVCSSTLSILHAMASAISDKMFEVQLGTNPVSIKGSPFFALSTESPLCPGTAGEGFSIPAQQALHYRCLTCEEPSYKAVVGAILAAAGLTHQGPMMDSITSLAASLAGAGLRVHFTPRMLLDVVNLATKHQDTFANTGSLTSLYTDTADYLRVYSETYLQKRVEEVPNAYEIPPEVSSSTSMFSDRKQTIKEAKTEVFSSPPHPLETVPEPRDQLDHSSPDDKPHSSNAEADNSLLLTEQFALMLALKDSILPSFGGASTEQGKKFIALLGSVFAGLSIEKVIQEEMDVLVKAKSTVSHLEMIDSVRESRAGSALGKAISPALKIPISLEEAIVGACQVLELDPTLPFQSNVIQFVQLVQAHKMVAVVGPPCCGKTLCAAVGAEALRLLGYSVLYSKINLNGGTEASLTGSWDEEGQWSGGILCSVLEDILQRLSSKKESPEEPQWLIIDGPCHPEDLHRIMHPSGLLKLPNKKTIKLPSELKIIVESSVPVEESVPSILISSSDVPWSVMLRAECKKARVEEPAQVRLRDAVCKVVDFLGDCCGEPKKLAVTSVRLFQGLAVKSRSSSAAVRRLAALYSVAWASRHCISSSDCSATEKWQLFLEKQSEEIGAPVPAGLSFYECYLDPEAAAMVPWETPKQIATDVQPSFVHTPSTLALNDILGVAVEQGIPVLLRGAEGSGKSFFVQTHLQTYSSSPVGNVRTIAVHLNQLSSPAGLVNRLLEHMTWRAGHTYVPTGARKLVCLLDSMHEGILEILRQHIMEGGFHHPGNHQWYHVSDVSYILICDKNWELDPRLLHHCLILDWPSYSQDDLQCIFSRVLEGAAVEPDAALTTGDAVRRIIDVSVDLHKQMQHLFHGKAHSSGGGGSTWSLFSFSDLAHMFQRLQASLPRVQRLEELLLLWQHQSYWTYAGRLSSDADVARYLDTFGMAVKKQFSNVPMTEFLYGYRRCILTPPSFASQPAFLPLKHSNHDKLREYFSEHLAEMQKSIPVPSVVFSTQMVEEACHLLNLLSRDYCSSHLLLVGHSNPEPLVALLGHITRFGVVRLSNLPATASKLASHFPPGGLDYDVKQFRKDLISLCIQAGAKGKRSLLYISDEEMPRAFEFLVHIHDLVNNCSVSHLFTEEEKSHALNLVRGHVSQAGIEFSAEVAWKFFTSNIMKNLRVALSVTGSPPSLLFQLAQHHSSLLRLLNLVYHRPWLQSDLLEVAELHLAGSGLDLTSSERKKLSHMLSSMHLSLLGQPGQLTFVNNWTYKHFVERFTSELKTFRERNSAKNLKLSQSIACIQDAAAEVASLQRTLDLELEQLEEKRYACVKLLGQTGQDTAIAGEHEKFLLQLKDRISHLQKMIPEYQHAYQVSVDRSVQLVADTKDLVAGMDKASLTELRAQHSPPREVELLLSAVIIVVKSANADLTWTKGAKRLMANIDRFLEMLSNFDESSAPSDALLSNLEPYMSEPALEVSYHRDQESRDSVVDICQWLNNVISYHQMCETKVKPLQQKLNSMQEFLSDLRKRLGTWNEKMLSYSERLKGMRISFEELSVDKCLYERHVQTIRKQLEDVDKFVKLLSDLEEMWSREVESNQEAHTVHFGSLAFAAGYSVYLTKAPYHTRCVYLQEKWPTCLRSCGVQLTWPKVAIDKVDFLHTQLTAPNAPGTQPQQPQPQHNQADALQQPLDGVSRSSSPAPEQPTADEQQSPPPAQQQSPQTVKPLSPDLPHQSSPVGSSALSTSDQGRWLNADPLSIDHMCLSMATHLVEVPDILLLMKKGWTGGQILDFLVVSISWRQSVLMLDPEGVGEDWVSEICSGGLLSLDGRRVDRGFLHSLETAMTAGQPTFVHHVLPRPDSVLMSVIEFAEFASGNGGVYIQFCGKRLCVHANFRLFLSTTEPLHCLERKLVSSTTVLDLSLCKNEMLRFLTVQQTSASVTESAESGRESSEDSDPSSTKQLLNSYFDGMQQVMNLVGASKRNNYSSEGILAELEVQIQALEEIQTSMSCIDLVSCAPAVSSLDPLRSRALLLYVFATLLSSPARPPPGARLALRQWTALLDQVLGGGDTSSEQRESLLLEEVLGLGNRVLSSDQWGTLLAGCGALCSAKQHTSPERMATELAVNSGLPIDDNNPHLQAPTLKALLESLLNCGCSKPVLLIHQEGLFLSNVIRCQLEHVLEDACKEKDLPLCKLDLSLVSIEEQEDVLSKAKCVLVDLSQSVDPKLPSILGRLEKVISSGCCLLLLCCGQPTYSGGCESVQLSSVCLEDHLDLHMGQSSEALAVDSPLTTLHTLLALSTGIFQHTPLPHSSLKLLFALCALHAHSCCTVASQDGARTGDLPQLSQWLHCLGQIKHFSAKGKVSSEDTCTFAGYVQEVYTSHQMQGVDVLSYIESAEGTVRVGPHTLSVPTVLAELQPEACSHHLLDTYRRVAKKSDQQTLENLLHVVFASITD
uniref:Axonemal dynein heavy chain E n=1 Tax=Halisarca dujardinii TaxID=2583056 RepID=A0A9E9FWX4_HALDU|nr:axonemal dynein heavy chain E [Halisarca dujardinii]